MKDQRRYWDTSCFLAWLKNEQDKVGNCTGIIQACEDGQLKLMTSTLTLVEVLYLNFKDKIPKTESDKIRAFFENDYIVTIPLDRMIAEKAQDLVWDFGVKPKDAVHVASALFAGTRIFDTFDDELSKSFNQKIGEPTIYMGKPSHSYQLKIDEKKDAEK